MQNKSKKERKKERKECVLKNGQSRRSKGRKKDRERQRERDGGFKDTLQSWINKQIDW